MSFKNQQSAIVNPKANFEIQFSVLGLQSSVEVKLELELELEFEYEMNFKNQQSAISNR
ncbi:hypothetical protein [Subsaximicrobium wynnwilliamsii]|uniref:hypothetical protein n=1 Tax=Subsaximicrobium wynnwilliamsii TaxID=291179 RepID=UPI0016754040|nr:hypothetical protein [Subsaximicrobium wynnwilliamsii]